MRTGIFWVVALCAALLTTSAEAAVDLKIGFVDMNKVQQGATVAKALKKELEKKRTDFQKQIATEEKSLHSIEKELVKQKDTLKGAELEKRGKAFQKKVVDYQKSVQKRQDALERSLSKAMIELRNETVKVINDIAQERELSAVLTQDSVILAAKELDITTEVIDRLNKKVKKIDVKWPSLKDSG